MTAHDRRSLSSLSYLLLGVVALAGCTPSTGQVEQGIERELPRLVGPAERYDVEIEGLRARSGEADRVVAVGLGVRPEGAPVVEQLRLDVRDLRYDRRRKRIERLGSAVATARVTEEDLAAFLEAQQNVQSASVQLEPPSGAQIQFRPAVGGLALPGATVNAVGEIMARGSTLHFDVSDVTVAGVELGEEAVEQISRLINPLVDFSEMPIALQVRDVRVEGGAIRLEATASAIGLGPESTGPAAPLR